MKSIYEEESSSLFFVLMVDRTGSNGVYAASGKIELHTRPKLVCVSCFFGDWGGGIIVF